MKRRIRPTGLPLGMIQALSALYSSTPLTDDERAAFRQQLADQRAREERGRAVAPDLLSTFDVERRE